MPSPDLLCGRRSSHDLPTPLDIANPPWQNEAMSKHDELVERMAKLRAFIDNGTAVLRRAGTPNERTAKIAQAIQAARAEHDRLRREAQAVRSPDWLPG